MHELAITQNILNIALDQADEYGACRIHSVHLVIGQLASIVDDSVQFYWDIISAGTIAQGAALHFYRVAARLNCEDCHRSYNITDGQLTCPYCGGNTVVVIAGEEFYVDSIEVEQ